MRSAEAGRPVFRVATSLPEGSARQNFAISGDGHVMRKVHSTPAPPPQLDLLAGVSGP